MQELDTFCAIMSDIELTAGGNERLPATVELYSDAFRTDPVISYFLNSLDGDELNTYRHSLFQALLKAAALNKGIWYEAHKPEGADGLDSKNHCCRAVLMPPETVLDGIVTIFKAGVFGVVWNLGLGGVRVSLATATTSFLRIADPDFARGS